MPMFVLPRTALPGQAGIPMQVNAQFTREHWQDGVDKVREQSPAVSLIIFRLTFAQCSSRDQGECLDDLEGQKASSRMCHASVEI
jgi:hypothetical protein